MEKPSMPDGSRALQCVGRLEIERPKPVGFVCGSLPVPTDNGFHAFNSALVPSSEAVSAPRYRMIPTETDLNRPPLLPNLPEKVLSIASGYSRTNPDMPCEGGGVAQNLTRKGEALAVSGLVEYGDEIDVIAPADILKQIFKMPYSKAQLSIAVHRVGQTLVMNTGPDIDEGEKLVRRHGSQSKCADQSLFLNFAMHSVRMEACDCPPTHHASSKSRKDVNRSSDFIGEGDTPQIFGRSDVSKDHHNYPKAEQDNFICGGSKKNHSKKGHDVVTKATQVADSPSRSVKESDKYRRGGHDGFSRVSFWQFHNFRMLLGSDLLIFGNDKYAAVSLHLWDVTHKVTALTWLEAWLDNVMASVPELAICYHENGVVRGYELLKTNDIFLLKGISSDGTPAFSPHVVQQNGLAVLRFLQKNCKQDPAAYWLYKSAGDDALQLFDLSIITKNHNSRESDNDTSTLPSLFHRERSDSLLSLGTLLYRIAHRLSLSMAPNNRAKCAIFFQQCLDCLDEPDHLVVRALAHEQFARLILSCKEELNLTFDALPIDSEVTVIEAEEEPLDLISSISRSITQEGYELDDKLMNKDETSDDSVSEVLVRMNLEANITGSGKLIAAGKIELEDLGGTPSFSSSEDLAVCEVSETSAEFVQKKVDTIPSKLAAIHHISQAIKSLRWRRQLKTTAEMVDGDNRSFDRSPVIKNLSVCTCGDADCIEVCDIRDWLPTSKLDHKLWKLILLLGESYLALGQAYMEDSQLHQALKVVELACSLYGSMPQYLEDARFISSMICSLASQTESKFRNNKFAMHFDHKSAVNSSPTDGFIAEKSSLKYLFWGKAWTLVGDLYVEFLSVKGKASTEQEKREPSGSEFRMSPEVVKEVKRLKKKLGQYSCRSCSLVNCSCKSDRVSSGSSASSSSRDRLPFGYRGKQGRKAHAKGILAGKFEENQIHHEAGNRRSSEIFPESFTDEFGPRELETNSTEISEDAARTSDSLSGPGSQEHTESGGIFKYLLAPVGGNSSRNLAAALRCYEEALKALHGVAFGSELLHSVFKKKGWVCNELGRDKLNMKELKKAEYAFADAIDAFREASDHTNIILINCNLGHGRRALAEEMVSKIDSMKADAIYDKAYKLAFETAKLEYRESLRYYGAARAEVDAAAVVVNAVSAGLRVEVFTQFANTYLRLGMLLAREVTVGEVYENGVLEDFPINHDRLESRKHERSANDAIRVALSIYESLGEMREQEAAYAHFQLACYQRDCCMKFLELDRGKSITSKAENSVLQKAKQYASLADRHWKKSMDVYAPTSHPTMHLAILKERSELLMRLSSFCHSYGMLESALSHLLEGRHVAGNSNFGGSIDDTRIHSMFWSQLQSLLKNMLAAMRSSKTGKSSVQQPTASSKSGDAVKLRELYKMSLKSTEYSQLQAMYELWES